MDEEDNDDLDDDQDEYCDEQTTDQGDNDDDHDDYVEETPSSKRRTPSKRKSPSKTPESTLSLPSTKKVKTAPPTVSKSKKSTSSTKKAMVTPKGKKKEKEPPPIPDAPVDRYKLEMATPGCLEGYTFVFTGVLPNMTREDSEDYVKSLGGRVTASLSSRTNYLVCGDILEDGRGVSEGSKYKKAKCLGEETCKILQGEQWLYAVTKLMDEHYRKKHGLPLKESISTISGGVAISCAKPDVIANGTYIKTALSIPPEASAKTVVNPYVRKVTNPYAKKAAPSTSSATPKESSSTAVTQSVGIAGDKYALWADKYAPRSSHDISGNAESVRRLKQCKSAKRFRVSLPLLYISLVCIY